jgi:hydroxypyruvate isomerase
MHLQFSVNLSMLFPEHPFLDRFSKAAQAGFAGVEYLFPYEFACSDLRTRLQDCGLTQALFNLHAGDTAMGEWGTLSNPSRRDYFRWSFHEALEYAGALNCARLNTMVGKQVAGLEREAQLDCALDNLAWAAPIAAEAGVTLLLEPLNTIDFPGCVLSNTAQAMQLVRQAGHPHVKLQYDIYHSQMTEGNLIATMTGNQSHIGHIQLADVPGRHEPGTGEINFPVIFDALTATDYSGWVGLEYSPSGGSDASLEWLPREFRGARCKRS